MAGNFHPIGFDQVINAKQRIQYVSTTRNLYGLAAPGTAEDQAGWAIREEVLDDQGRTIEINFASATSEYGVKWSDRLTLVYS